MAEKKEPYQIAGENWARYQYGIDRGHREYTGSAKFLEGCYLGGGYDADGLLIPGGQWSDSDLNYLQAQGRPAYEFNEIKPAIDAAIGYQVANRMQISFRPDPGTLLARWLMCDQRLPCRLPTIIGCRIWRQRCLATG